MITAIVLVNADVDQIPTVAEKIAEQPHVHAVYSVAGRYDIVAMIRVSEHEQLETTIPGALDRVPGISRTETLIAFRTYSEQALESAYDLGVD